MECRHYLPSEMIKDLWGGRQLKYACLQASSTRGGILMICDSRAWNGEILEIVSYTLTCKFVALLQEFEGHIQEYMDQIAD